MPEDQKPFIHEDGTSTPAPGRTPAAKLLGSVELFDQIRELQRERAMRARLYPGWIDNGRLKKDSADAQERNLARAIESLQLLIEPSVNATVASMKTLTPDMQALLADVAIALAEPGIGRQKLANDLRRRIDGRPMEPGR